MGLSEPESLKPHLPGNVWAVYSMSLMTSAAGTQAKLRLPGTWLAWDHHSATLKPAGFQNISSLSLGRNFSQPWCSPSQLHRPLLAIQALNKHHYHLLGKAIKDIGCSRSDPDCRHMWRLQWLEANTGRSGICSHLQAEEEWDPPFTTKNQAQLFTVWIVKAANETERSKGRSLISSKLFS